MTTSIGELMKEFKGDVKGWEEGVLGWAYDLAREVAELLLEEMDETLMREKGSQLQVKGFRRRCITTIFGDVRIRRRLYQDEKGRSRFLLDEAIGLRSRSQVSPKLEELAVYLCSHLPFEKSEKLLKALVPAGISHTTIHRLVGRVIDPYMKQEDEEVAQMFEDGVIPESEGRFVDPLMIEGDGTMISLQREASRRTEVKIGIAYEGWVPVGRDRYRLKGKTTYAGIMEGERFWEGFATKLAKKYSYRDIEHVIVGGDGAAWVRGGAEVMGGQYQLDRFHLHRALRSALPDQRVNEVYQACIVGDVEEADRLLCEEQRATPGETAHRIAQVRGYLMNNAQGLRDYRLEMDREDLRGLGAIESNVDKIIATRMKKRGMSWTRCGGDRMARLISVRDQGELHQWIKYRPERPSLCPEERSPKINPTVDKCGQYDPRQWLEGALPVLAGPHCNRPWVQILNRLAHSNSMIT